MAEAIDQRSAAPPKAVRKRELGRGERVLPGIFRLRLPLPWPGVPHCNAWAVAAADGVVHLSWPLWASNYGLEMAAGALPPWAAWTNAGVSPGASNGQNVVTLPIDAEMKVFRLSQP